MSVKTAGNKSGNRRGKSSHITRIRKYIKKKKYKKYYWSLL